MYVRTLSVAMRRDSVRDFARSAIKPNLRDVLLAENAVTGTTFASTHAARLPLLFESPFVVRAEVFYIVARAQPRLSPTKTNSIHQASRARQIDRKRACLSSSSVLNFFPPPRLAVRGRVPDIPGGQVAPGGGRAGAARAGKINQ
jgi:hypothetical protein